MSESHGLVVAQLSFVVPPRLFCFPQASRTHPRYRSSSNSSCWARDPVKRVPFQFEHCQTIVFDRDKRGLNLEMISSHTPINGKIADA
jgi:hypothetical protein